MRPRPVIAPCAAWRDPEAVFRQLFAGETRVVWLDSGPDAIRGTSVIGVGSRLVTQTVGARESVVTVDGAQAEGSVFDFLRRELPRTERVPDDTPSGFTGGWVGWLGYGLLADSTGLRGGIPSAHPDAALLFVDRVISFDHARRRMSIVTPNDSESSRLWRREMRQSLESVTEGAAPAIEPPAPAGASWSLTDDQYLASIRECQCAIVAGDAYQLCLTNEATVDAHPDPVETWLRLRTASPSHHGGFIRIDDLALLSSSPEQFLTVSSGGIVESKPIKGTRPRGVDAADDAAQITQLVESEKERAENLMIVDLMRNDMGRVCEVGSVSVPALFAVETYAQVHQLVSTVRGRLNAGFTAVDAVQSCFPAGSMTGAPKRSAISILARLEGRARGVYSGVFGYFGVDGTVDLAMVIRSILLDGHRATIGAGGGITALSVPEHELDEVKIKAAALLAVLGVRPQ